ncbi:MAG: sensor domain-containing diguanylate cyclase [Nitrospirae bacterium]|nr:sensor domain-containing diguanylate cyclase [Nitrospirota bacterium]
MVEYKQAGEDLQLYQKNLQQRIKNLEIEAAQEIVDEMFAILDGLEGAVYVSDMKSYRILRVNKYIKKHYGNNILGKKCYKIFQELQDGPCSYCTNDRLIIEGKPGPPVIWDFRNTKTGRWYHCIDKAIQWPDGRYVRMEIAVDITERKKGEVELRDSERFLNMVFESINDPFNIVGSDYRIKRANESYARMRGKRVYEIIGKRCYEVLYNRNTICEDCSVRETFDSGKPFTKEKLLILPAGLNTWIEIFTYPIIDENGKITGVIEYTRDITKRKKAEAERDILVDRLQYLLRIDDLTGLLNRRAILEKLEEEVNRAKRYRSQLALIICDIDYFKEINDTYGHDIGDKALQIISSLIKSSLRNTDIIGRYGGDEFFLILPETSMEGAKEIAERIRFIIKDFNLKLNKNKSIKTTVSIGVAEFDAGKEDINSFIKRADNALYVAKDKGRNRVYIIGDE